MANVKERFRVYAVRDWVRKSILLCAVAGILGIAYLKFKPVYFAGSYLLKVALGFMILLFVLQLTARISIGNKVSLFIGGISYEIYLLHGSVFDFIRGLPFKMASGVFILLSIVITVLLSVLIRFLSKVLIRMV